MTPRTEKLVKELSLAASVTLTVALVASALVVLWPRVTHALGIKPKRPAAAYRAGDRVDVPADWYRSSPRTLVLFARASCGACEKARPFLKDLTERLSGKSAIVVAGGVETKDEDAAFARSLGVTDSSIKTTPSGLRVRVTPTLVLVDDRGTILESWEGIGPPDKQKAIVEAIEKRLN
jgi:thioredoxin-related protein